MSTIHEIAIQKVRPEASATFGEVRRQFLEKLHQLDGNEKDWTFRSFFTMPEPDDGEVLVGITRWSSMGHFVAASEGLGSTELAARLFSSVQMKAFVQVRTADGEPFALEEELPGPDAILEVAVRRPKDGVTEDQYDSAHDAFFNLVRAQPGYAFDREFVDVDGARVVLIGWDSSDAFQAALGSLQHRREMGAFFALIDVQAYQATTLA